MIQVRNKQANEKQFSAVLNSYYTLCLQKPQTEMGCIFRQLLFTRTSS